MNCICPECKNQIDLGRYPGLAVGNVIECDTCGITLAVKGIEEKDVWVDIVDEGK